MDHGRLAVVSVPELYGSETLTWVVAGLLVYWLGIIALQRADRLPSYVGTQGPILTFHTKRGRAFLERLSAPKRFWRAWANLGVGIAIVVMVGMFVFTVFSAYAALQAPEPTEINQPRNFLAIPGVNDFLPLSATPGLVFGLLVGLVVHEGGHGLLCRVEDIEIESMGVAMLAIVPMGAFVEPDQKEQREASRGGQTRMFAAGVTNNFAVALLAFALLFGPIAGAIAVAPGGAVGHVIPGSPAADAGIEQGDRITAVDGTEIESNDHLRTTLEENDADEVTIDRADAAPVDVERWLLVTAALEDGPADVTEGDRIRAVDGEPVRTIGGFYDAIGDAEVVELTIEREGGETVTRDVPIGAYALVASDGPLAAAGATAGEGLIVTTFDGERVQSGDDLQDALSETDPGDEVSVAGYHDGQRVSYEVTLGERSPVHGGGAFGYEPVPGISGFGVNDIGIQYYPAEEYLAVLGGGEGSDTFGSILDSYLGKLFLSLFLPVIGFIGFLPFNFAGFAGGVENFYQTQGPLSVLGDGTVFVVANLLFWTGWINVQLGFFNCLPAFPLDGGHILRTSTEAVVSRLPVDATRGMVRTVTTTVGLTMLVSLLLMLFGPELLAG